MISISESNLLLNAVNIYPNPAIDGRFSVSSSDKIVELKITNVLGVIISQSKPQLINSSLQIDEAGVYFVTIKTKSEKIVTQKLVVQ